MTVTLTLPEPPSANRYWRNVKGRMVLSREAKDYKRAVATLAGHLTPTRAVVEVCLDWYRGRRSGDLDNRIKQSLDALKGLAYHDDAQIVEIHARRFDDKANPRLIVTITPAEERAA